MVCLGRVVERRLAEGMAVITTSVQAVSCSSHPHLSQHRAAASTSTKGHTVDSVREWVPARGTITIEPFSRSVPASRRGGVQTVRRRPFGVDLPNSVYSDGTLIYENTILTKISGYAHVLA